MCGTSQRWRAQDAVVCPVGRERDRPNQEAFGGHAMNVLIHGPIVVTQSLSASKMFLYSHLIPVPIPHTPSFPVLLVLFFLFFLGFSPAPHQYRFVVGAIRTELVAYDKSPTQRVLTLNCPVSGTAGFRCSVLALGVPSLHL